MNIPKNTLYYREFYQKQGTAVQGTWTWGTDALQTDFASVMGEAAGFYYNISNTNLDEYKWSNVFLTKGTYKITIVYIKFTNRGIAEVLFGTASLGTLDQYGALTYNQTWTITFTLTSDQTADLRFRVNGHNASSSGYCDLFSRFRIEKTG